MEKLQRKIVKIRSKTFYSFVLLAIIYASVNLLAAPPRTTLQKYHISSSSLHLLNATIVVPVIAIWFVALYGYQRLRTYAGYIKDNKDGRQVVKLTRGLMLLAFWLPVSSTLSAVLNMYGVHHPGATPMITIIINYLTLLFPLGAFIWISQGARGLSELSKQRPTPTGTNLMAIVLIVAGVFYGYLVANAHQHVHTIYHMPMLVVLLTLVIPYIYSWFLGILAAYEIHMYSKKVNGIIYRKSWNALAIGLVWIIVFSIVFQYFTTVSAKLNNLSLGWILVIIYTLLPLMAIGYIFVALGAKRLTKIEEV